MTYAVAYVQITTYICNVFLGETVILGQTNKNKVMEVHVIETMGGRIANGEYGKGNLSRIP